MLRLWLTVAVAITLSAMGEFAPDQSQVVGSVTANFLQSQKNNKRNSRRVAVASHTHKPGHYTMSYQKVAHGPPAPAKDNPKLRKSTGQPVKSAGQPVKSTVAQQHSKPISLSLKNNNNNNNNNNNQQSKTNNHLQQPTETPQEDLEDSTAPTTNSTTTTTATTTDNATTVLEAANTTETVDDNNDNNNNKDDEQDLQTQQEIVFAKQQERLNELEAKLKLLHERAEKMKKTNQTTTTTTTTTTSESPFQQGFTAGYQSGFDKGFGAANDDLKAIHNFPANLNQQQESAPTKKGIFGNTISESKLLELAHESALKNGLAATPEEESSAVLASY